MVPATRTSSASTYPQHMTKTPLLPTPPVPARQFYNRNHYNQHISGPCTTKIQHILSLFKTSNTEQLQILLTATHSRTIYCISTVPAPRILHKAIPTDTTTTTSSIYRTISTDVRTLSTTSILFTSHTTAPSTTLHLMKKEDEKYRLL